MEAAPSGKDETAQLCQTLEKVDFADSESSGAEKSGPVEQNDVSGGSDTAESDDTEVFWREMEAELKKTDTEEKSDAGEVPSASGAGDGIDQHQQRPSAILVQEEEVMDKFQLPPLKIFYADLSSIRTNKIVVVYPLTEEQLAAPELVKIRRSEHCLEYRIRHIRQGTDSCFLSLYFASKANADDVVEQLKAILPEEQVEFASQESHVNKMIASWSSNQKPNPVLPDCTLLIKNIGNTVTVDKLKDLFPTSEDIVLPREKQDGKGPLRNKGYAYAVFLSPESANLAAESCAKDKPELDGHSLEVMKYFEPKSKPEGLLSLVERKLVLKQGSKSSAMIEKKKNGEDVKAIDSRQKVELREEIQARNLVTYETGLAEESEEWKQYEEEMINMREQNALLSSVLASVQERLKKAQKTFHRHRVNRCAVVDVSSYKKRDRKQIASSVSFDLRRVHAKLRSKSRKQQGEIKKLSLDADRLRCLTVEKDEVKDKLEEELMKEKEDAENIQSQLSVERNLAAQCRDNNHVATITSLMNTVAILRKKMFEVHKLTGHSGKTDNDVSNTLESSSEVAESLPVDSFPSAKPAAADDQTQKKKHGQNKETLEMSVQGRLARSTKIHVGQFMEEMTSDDLYNAFKGFGEIEHIYIPRIYQSYAFVYFWRLKSSDELRDQYIDIKGSWVHASRAFVRR